MRIGVIFGVIDRVRVIGCILGRWATRAPEDLCLLQDSIAIDDSKAELTTSLESRYLKLHNFTKTSLRLSIGVGYTTLS